MTSAIHRFVNPGFASISLCILLTGVCSKQAFASIDFAHDYYSRNRASFGVNETTMQARLGLSKSKINVEGPPSPDSAMRLEGTTLRLGLAVEAQRFIRAGLFGSLGNLGAPMGGENAGTKLTDGTRLTARGGYALVSGGDLGIVFRTPVSDLIISGRGGVISRSLLVSQELSEGERTVNLDQKTLFYGGMAAVRCRISSRLSFIVDAEVRVESAGDRSESMGMRLGRGRTVGGALGIDTSF